MLREDFKSDSSLAHFGYICIMLAACQLCTNPKYGGKDLGSNIRSFQDLCLHQSLRSSYSSQSIDSYTTSSLLSLAPLAASILVNPVFLSPRASQDAAQLLLSAAHLSHQHQEAESRANGSLTLPLTTALLTERAAHCFAQSKLFRKYVSNLYAATHHLVSVPPEICPAAREQALAMLCTVASLCTAENWTLLEIASAFRMVTIMRGKEGEASPRVLLLLLYILQRQKSSAYRACKSSSADGNAALDAMLSPSYTTLPLMISLIWTSLSLINLLRDDTPISDIPSGQCLEIEGLELPAIDMSRIKLLVPMNGMQNAVTPESLRIGSDNEAIENYLQSAYLFEHEFNLMRQFGTQSTPIKEAYIEQLSSLESELVNGGSLSSYRLHRTNEYSLDEPIHVDLSIRNPLSTALTLEHIQLLLRTENCEDAVLIVDAKTSNEEKLQIESRAVRRMGLSITPPHEGRFVLSAIQWRLNGGPLLVNRISKPGALQHDTMLQRSQRSRSADESLSFQVTSGLPLLRVWIEGLPVSYSVLDGEVLQVTIRIENQALLPVHELLIKIQNASAIIILSDDCILEPNGPSLTIIELPKNLSISPGESFVLRAVFRFSLTLIANASEKKVFQLSVLVATRESIGLPESLQNRRYAFFSQLVIARSFTALPSLM